MVPAGGRGWTEKAEPACDFASTRLRHGHARCEHGAACGRRPSAPHGPHFPRQLVSHSPTHWITQDALLDHDRRDRRGHARTPWSHPGSWSWTVHHSTLLRNFAASCATPGSTSNCDMSSGTSRDTLSRWTGRTCAPSRTRSAKRWPNTSRVLLGSRVQLRTCQSGLQHRIRAHSRTERRQPAHRTAGWRFICWNEVEQRELLAEAKRLLETGELFPRGTAKEPHAPDADAQASDCEPEAHVMEPLADDHSSDTDDRTHWCRGISGTSGASSCRCSKESSHESA